jgi:hypothetical protein
MMDMNRRLLAGLLGAAQLASCGQSEVADPTPTGTVLEGRWISLVVENTGDPDQHLTVVDDRELARVVGVADPAVVPGHATVRVRFFVPDSVPWMVKSNEMLLLSAGDVAGFCGALPIRIHVAWDAGFLEQPIWMGEAPGFPGRPPNNCDASHRTTMDVPAAP